MKKDNVVIGPWENSSSLPPELSEEELKERELKKMSENFKSIDILTENLVVQLIHSLKENNFDITSADFIRDIAFVNEVIKGLIYKQYNYQHIMAELVNKLFKVEKSNDGHFITQFRADRLAKILKDL